MGCGASTQSGEKRDKKYEDDDEESEGELSDVMSDTSATSESSTTSSKSVTRVTTTRLRMASSSAAVPKLHHPVYEPGMDMGDTQPSKPSRVDETNFLFGDFNVDKSDVARQRVERLNRVRRPSRVVDPEASARRQPMEVFMINDFVVSAMDDESNLPDQSAASVVIPTGFRRLTSMMVRTLVGHTDRVKALVLGREERSFLSAAITDSVVSMSDMKGHELNCYPGHDAYIVALAISRDGKFFTSSARDSTIGVWEYSTNREHAMKKQVRAFGADEAQNAISISLAFGYNNRHLIAGGQDGCCRVWEIERPGLPFVYDEHHGVIVSVSPHPSEPVVASASGDKQIHLWNYETGKLVTKPLVGHESAVISVTFTLDGNSILSNDDRTCRMWNASTGQATLTVKLDAVMPAQPKVPRETPQRRDSEYLRNIGMRYPKLAERLETALTGQNTPAFRAAQMERVTARTIFTVSALLPGALSNSYFAVASTTKEVFIINAATGQCEGAIPTKAPVFAMHSGTVEKLIFGDIFGNVYTATFR
uniref:Guanine nucleotide-binding protein subunit beta-like protein n=1 Tax=Neobodo designis TaxID=312471 RepID=A0A7S1PWY3_NEODS|mmetsp:Transcript_23331/g.72268  ORF Transcript_23331/g.72268 Transcript_23331/m.72268 type:complete len:536 (+) Transcript_23331:229-1836(+)